MIGDGQYESQPIDVDDVVLACRAALESDRFSVRQVIELAGDEVVSFRDFRPGFPCGDGQ